MKLAIEIVAAAISAIAFVSLCVYIVLAVRGNSITLYSTSNSRLLSRRQNVFLALAAIAFLICMYKGAETMLWWIPDEDGEFSARAYLALLFTFFCLDFGKFIDSATHDKFERKIISERARELERILEASTKSWALAALKKEYKEKISAIYQNGLSAYPEIEGLLPEGRRAQMYRQLTWDVEEFESQIKTLVENALNDERRKREEKIENERRKQEEKIENERRKQEEKIENEAKQIEAAKRKADHVRQLRDYRKALETAMNKKLFEIVQGLERMADGSRYLIDANFVAQKWQALERSTNAILSLSEEEIRSGTKGPFSINRLFEACVGISVIASSTVMAAYSGDSHGGSTELYVEVDGHKQSYFNALTLGNSIDALIEGLYVAFELPKKGVFWHGLYGRDYTFLLDDSQIIEVLRNQLNIPPDNSEIAKIDRPCGIRISKNGNIYRVSCLAAYPNGAIVDMTVLIDNGRLVVEPEDKIVNSNTRMFY